MNLEEVRLRTFKTWPVNAPVCVRGLSASGFYSTGHLLEVECNWCHTRISNWKFGDDIEHRHINANPQCEFIKNKQTCGNIPLCVTSNVSLGGFDVSSYSRDCTQLDLLVEKDRLATFTNWPNPNITPQSLAKAGFFYRSRLDEVECAWCKGVIAQWEKQDNAFEEHRRFFPDCPKVLLGPLIGVADDEFRDIGIQQISPPKNPKYTSLYARLRTYTNWPIPSVQKPEDLAQAGLYYQQIDDQVRCFHCNMGLRSWEKEDDPWFEHAKWYPMCEFVRLVKGADYIRGVQELTRNAQKSFNPIVPITVDEAMKTELIKSALKMGINNEVLKHKIHEKILQTGCPHTTIEDLLKDMFDNKEDIDLDCSSSFGISHSNTNLGCVTTNNSNTQCDLTSNYVSHNKNNIDCNTPRESLSFAIGNSNDKDINIKRFEKSNSKMGLQQDNISTSHLCSNIINNSKHLSLEEENRKLKDARLCKVCLDEEVGVVYLPCGHLVTCVQCAPSVNHCPMCRTTIKGFVRTYLS